MSLNEARHFYMWKSVINLSNCNLKVKLIRHLIFQVINYQSQLIKYLYISHLFKKILKNFPSMDSYVTYCNTQSNTTTKNSDLPGLLNIRRSLTTFNHSCFRLYLFINDKYARRHDGPLNILNTFSNSTNKGNLKSSKNE